jgi:hypothetical protein
MGWGLRVLAVLVALIALGLGLWPVTLMAAVYLVFSFKKPMSRRPLLLTQQVLSKSKRPWGRYAVGVVLLLFSGIAQIEGGTLSPAVFLLGGFTVVFLPHLRKRLPVNQLVPLGDSILLRNRIFPILWYALAEVKLEAQDQARGIAAMEGQLLVFAGKNPSTLKVVSAYALGYRRAESKVVRILHRETQMLSQRGAHILPLDSAEAAERLSHALERLKVGTDGFDAVSSLPFDVIALRVKDGLVVSHRAFNIVGGGAACIPSPDLPQERQPLLAEVVQEIGEKHGWPAPDQFSPFLAALDASRTEPLADRILTRGDDTGGVAVEAPGGAEVKLTRAQLRAVARIYA